MPSRKIAPRNGGDFSDVVQPATKVPTGVILVKGAWSSASDSVTPLPEGGSVINNVFTDQYFGMTYPLPADWAEKYKGPPPSDTRPLCAGADQSYGNIQSDQIEERS